MGTDHSQSDALIESGNLDESRGNLDEAQRKYAEAVQLTPAYARAWLNLGIAFAAKSESLEAIDAYQRAVALDPSSAASHYNLGLALAGLGKSKQAEEALNAAIAYRPIFPDAYAALADLFENRGQLEMAAQALATASAQAPTHPGYLLNLGLIKKKTAEVDAAEAMFRTALDCDPTYAPATLALSAVLREKTLHIDACAVLDQLLTRDPGNAGAASSKLFTLLFRDDLRPEDVYSEHRRLGAVIQQNIPVRFTSYGNRESPRRRQLKIGYVSGDFKRHSVAFFALPVIETHDRNSFKIFCYSNTSGSDDVTSKFRQVADSWRDIQQLGDNDAASLVYDDKIDILVDLSGHTAGNRLGIFAQRPAPVQATWLGYLSTTGLDSIDYRIGDSHTDPAGATDTFFTEDLAILPNSQWCYRPYVIADQVYVPPCVPNRFPTFGSFNQFAKISPTVRRLWGRILVELPTARLLVVGVPPGESQQSFVSDFAAMGVGLERLHLVDRVDLQAYYQLFNQVDIALDTTPYSGATTSCDAFWMGLPVITLAGRHSIARSSASLLTSLGMEALIAASGDEYVSKAVELARDADRLSDMRRGLRERMRRSPLMDETRFARDMERLYQGMWNRWCEDRVRQRTGPAFNARSRG